MHDYLSSTTVSHHREELLLNDFYTIGVRFDNPSLDSSRVKQYTYKVDNSIKVEKDDFVVVKTADGFKVVIVSRVDIEPDINYDSNIDYKYIVQKVDDIKYQQLVERSRKIKLMLADLERRQLKNNLAEEFKDSLTDEEKKILQLECNINLDK